MNTSAPLQNAAVKSKRSNPLSHGGLLLQRKCACGAPTSSLTSECEECKSKKSLQAKLTIGASNDPLEKEADRVADQVLAAPANSSITATRPQIQRFTGQAAGQTATAPASVDQVLASSGRPLEPTLRQDMEQRFGHDFSRVRVHSGAAAEQSARDVNANAYTVGHDMVFGAGRFAPDTQEGQRLIAHELTHVVQQSRAGGIHEDQSSKKIDLSFVSHSAVQREVTEDENEDERHRLSVITESHTPILRRQNRDEIPPPPPAYPHFSQLFFGDVADKIGELEMTCDDRRERGFWVFWNESTKKAYPGDVFIGEPAPKDCGVADIELGPMPRDRGNILVAGLFHNHPPRLPECTKWLVGGGPSKRDKDTSSRLKLPGIVQDFTSLGPNTTCHGNPRSTFFFGPPRREV